MPEMDTFTKTSNNLDVIGDVEFTYAMRENMAASFKLMVKAYKGDPMDYDPLDYDPLDYDDTMDPMDYVNTTPILADEHLLGQRSGGKQNSESKIIPCPLQLAIRNDEELNKLHSGVTIAQGGVLPNIQAVLLPKKTAQAGKKGSQSQEF